MHSGHKDMFQILRLTLIGSKKLSNFVSLITYDLCDGSQEEYDTLMSENGRQRELLLNLITQKRPNSYLADLLLMMSHELKTAHLSVLNKEDAGPTNNWRDPKEMRALLKSYLTAA